MNNLICRLQEERDEKIAAAVREANGVYTQSLMTYLEMANMHARLTTPNPYGNPQELKEAIKQCVQKK